jgi:hypothetical protein
VARGTLYPLGSLLQLHLVEDVLPTLESVVAGFALDPVTDVIHVRESHRRPLPIGKNRVVVEHNVFRLGVQLQRPNTYPDSYQPYPEQQP